MRFSPIYNEDDIDILCFDLLSNIAWCAVASAVLIARYHQELLCKVSYFLLLVYYFAYLSDRSRPQLLRYSYSLTQLLQAFSKKRDGRNKYWTYNLAELFVSHVVNEFMSYFLPGHPLLGAFPSTLLYQFVYGDPVFQLFLQKQLTRILRMNVSLFKWRDYVIEFFWCVTSRCLNIQSTGMMNGLWWICHKAYEFLDNSVLHRIQLSLAFYSILHPLVFGFAASMKLSLWVAGAIIFYRFVLREFAKFSNPDPPDYKYSKLDEPDDIRLVLLHPRFGFRPVCCSIVEGPRMLVCVYEAISYTWGSRDRTEEIIVDGCKMKVTQSVYEILATYSSHFVPQLLWIDAICINQDDNEEKAEAIPMMGQIYSEALFTTVFLGQSPLPGVENKKRGIMLPYRYDGIRPQDDQTREHFKTARLTFDLFNEFRILEKPLQRMGKDIYEAYESYTPNTSKHGNWQALAILLQHPWFTRVWVVQEVALSANIKVRYGDEIIDWATIASAMRMLHNLRHFRLWLEWSHNVHIWHNENSSLYNIIRMNDMREEYSATKDINITMALAQSHYFKAGNPRDHVYGLMSLCKGRQYLRVDYDAEEEEVYMDAAAELVQRKSFRQLFSTAGVGTRSESGEIAKKLPSWVPDWTDSPKYSCIFLPDEDPFLFGLKLMGLKRLPPGTPSAESFNVIIGGMVLKISATLVDTIAEVGTPLFNKAASMQSDGVIDEMCCLWKDYHICRNFLTSSRFTSDPYTHDQQPQSLLDAFHRSIVTGFDAKLTDWVRHLDNFRSKPDTSSPARKERIYTVLESMDWTTKKVELSCGPRRLFVANDGWIGLCPPGTRQGDEIWVASGVKIPIVLRKADGHPEGFHQLVGECYCHGLKTAKLESTTEKKATIMIV